MRFPNRLEAFDIESKRIRSRLSRVDMQVSLMTAITVMASILVTFLFHYTLSYRDMIASLQERVASIYEYVEDELDAASFSRIRSVEDAGSPGYQRLKALLEGVKNSTGVMYLYTAAQREDGSLIYVVDGLDSDSPDFRNPGDPIEPEIRDDMLRALSGEIVMPDEIHDTSWGHIFICYLPIHGENGIAGVLGIEFEAARQYFTYLKLRIGTVIIAALTCLAAALLAVRLFKRISNPTYRDLANTDFLTGLKNRNAFETDMHNLARTGGQAGCVLVSADLDGLKTVNDTLGHAAGDEYIRAAARALEQAADKDGVLYRVGGDEFAIIMRHTNTAAADALIERIRQEVDRAASGDTPLSISFGRAPFDAVQDRDVFDAYRRADQSMYSQKAGKKRASRQTTSEEH